MDADGVVGESDDVMNLEGYAEAQLWRIPLNNLDFII